MSEKIEYVELRIVDILGRLKAMIVPCTPVDTLEELCNDPIMKDGTSVDGSSILGLSRVESSDLRMRPDSSTLIELPYMAQRTAAAMCFVQEKGEIDTDLYYPTDTRGVLHKVCKNLLSKDMSLKTKVEPEFHFVTADGDKFDEGGYADSYPKSPGIDVLLEIASNIQKVGMKPRVLHHEVGESQQEIEIAYDDIRRMADNLIIFKNLARAIAQEAGIDVNFMPKPFEGAAGSGLHCHLQLWSGDTNLFGDDTTDGISDTAKNFIAGLMEHAAAITAIANPSVNSYKRLVPHHEAPVFISWGMMNRTALIRVPLFNIGRKAAIEFRSPDSMANPYLLFAVLLACGMDGIKRGLIPPSPRSEDIFSLSDKQRDEFGITALPANLGEALDALEQDNVIIQSLGTEIIQKFIAIKRDEWNDYRSEIVTEWEWKTYADL